MKILLRVAKEAKRYKGLFTVAIISILAVSLINLITPWILSAMAGLVADGINETSLKQIETLTLYLVGLYVLRVGFRYLGSFLPHKAAWSLVKSIRMEVYQKLQSLSLEFFRNNQSGDLVSRTINDTATIELLFAHLIPETITNIITVSGVTIILFVINFRLAAATCLSIPFIVFSAWIFSTKIRPNFQKTQKALGKLSTQLLDNFSGIQEIQIFGQQEKATKQVEERVSSFTTFMIKALNLSAIFHPVVELFVAIGTVLIVAYGGYLASKGQIDVGDIVAFLLYLSLFYAPISGAGNLLEQVQQALAGAERVIEILDAPELIKDNPQAKVFSQAVGEISFEDVSFSYVQEAPVLKHVTFKVEPGEMIALVGATGVGKSTIANLMARFYDPLEGTIRFDGIDIKELELKSLRRNIAMVLQDTFLFNGTIADNIAFAKEDATDEEIEKVAKVARLHQEIMALPDGYQTKVGERGAKLSGGQKQRIAIARALICDVPVLILDEATASVDLQTEADIQQAIADIAGTRTIVVIAHRISTIKRATKIIVLKEGKIVQSGTHEELVNKRGLYRSLWQIQEKGARLTR